jgi:hypothetical protein
MSLCINYELLLLVVVLLLLLFFLDQSRGTALGLKVIEYL